MRRTRSLVTAITAVALVATSPIALAGDGYSFPSADGLLIAASTPAFFLPPSEAGSPALPDTAFVGPAGAYGKGIDSVPIVQPPTGMAFYGDHARNADPYGYRFLTYSLTYSGTANYANDYYRLFAPGYAVSEWTDRVSGFVEMGHGGPVDSWTAAAYFMPSAGGPHKDTTPDLTLMPQFQPHPELQDSPAFKPPAT